MSQQDAIKVTAEIREEQVQEEIVTVELDAAAQTRLNELQQQRSQLLQQLAAIDAEIERIMSEHTVVKTVTTLKKVAYFTCPKCGAPGRVVLSRPLPIRVRCVCNTILDVQTSAT